MSLKSFPQVRNRSLLSVSFALVAVVPLFLFTASPCAFAFWYGSAPSDGLEVKQAADPSSQTVETLASGVRFTASDEPSQGFYRVRTKNNSGYVPAQAIESQNPKHPGATQTPQIPQTGRPAGRKSSPGKRAPKWSVKLLAGLTLSNPSDVSNAIGTTSLSNPLSFGLEGAYQFNKNWRFAVRFEYEKKSVSGPDSTTNDNFNIGLTAIIFTVGADYLFVDAPRYDIFGGLRAGLGKASLSSVATSQPTPNETDFSGTSLATLFLVGADYKPWTHFGFGAEAGYRVFSTSQSGPTTTGNGSAIWTSNVGLGFSGLYGALSFKILF